MSQALKPELLNLLSKDLTDKIETLQSEYKVTWNLQLMKLKVLPATNMTHLGR